ncbi:MAG TPA: DedA family protein [Candidatus Paceibacterota bacterium]|nr:DedA family protein [Candidatus Paceibacterota bacterium]HRY76711.1 DedA family protein [Candidatus Paceibacterota bacterium]
MVKSKNNMFFLVIYGILFLAMIVMGEEAILFAGMLSHLGFMNFWIMMLVALTGAYAGDLLFFWLGWKYGDAVVDKFGKYVFIPRKRFAKVRKIFQTSGRWILVISKFIYGLSHLTLLAAGAAKMPIKKVVKNQLWSSLVWVLLFGGIGYLFSSAISIVTRDLKTLGIFLVAVLIFSLAISRFVDYIIDTLYP